MNELKCNILKTLHFLDIKQNFLLTNLVNGIWFFRHVMHLCLSTLKAHNSRKSKSCLIVKIQHGCRDANENKVSVMPNKKKISEKKNLSISVQVSQNSKPSWNIVIYYPIFNRPCIRFNQVCNINTGQSFLLLYYKCSPSIQ